MDLQARPPRKLLDRHFAYAASDTPFRSWCRLKQSLYRSQRGLECGTVVRKRGEQQIQISLGNYLTDKDAEAGANFVNEEIHQLANQRLRAENRESGEVIEESRLRRNLLTSQTLCFNLFLPQAQSNTLATEIWKSVLPDHVARVTTVKLEHSPGRGHDQLGTGDHSAFDAFVEYVHVDGAVGIIAVETKYTESFSAKGSRPDARLEGLALSTKLFSYESWQRAKSMSTQQLWRTHLLAETMRGEPCRHVMYLVLHAEGDKECTDLLPEYAAAMSHHPDPQNRFEQMTLETLVSTAGKQLTGKDADWLNRFSERYLDWSPVEEAIAANEHLKD